MITRFNRGGVSRIKFDNVLTCLCGKPEVKYTFIKSGACEAPLVKQFEWLSVSSSGYYDWATKLDKPMKRNERSRVIDKAIRIAFENRKQRYGSPRLYADLNESGFSVALNSR